MTKGYEVVPILGGMALTLGGVAALMCDRLDMQADPAEPRPILIRYTSQATYDLQARSHWIFLCAVCIFAPCLMVTAQWQASLAGSNDSAIILHATMCAMGGFGVALLPMGNALGTGIHMLTAACFGAFGINYTFQVWMLADDRGDDALAWIRLLLAFAGVVGGVLTIFSVVPAVWGTEALANHKSLVQKYGDGADEDMEGFLTASQRLTSRLCELSLAVGQIAIATTMAATLLTGVVEAGDVEDSPSAAWIVGVLGGFVMMGLTVVFYATNNWWYTMCQAKADVDDDEENDEDLRGQPVECEESAQVADN